MTKQPPTWLKRGVYATHPHLRLVFEPLRLRFLPHRNHLVVFYTANKAVPVPECRLAEPTDLLNEQITLYLAGQRYAKQIEGQRIRLSCGAKQHLIQLESDASVLSFATAFDGQIVDLSAGDKWIDQLFQESQS